MSTQDKDNQCESTDDVEDLTDVAEPKLQARGSTEKFSGEIPSRGGSTATAPSVVKSVPVVAPDHFTAEEKRKKPPNMRDSMLPGNSGITREAFPSKFFWIKNLGIFLFGVLAGVILTTVVAATRSRESVIPAPKGPEAASKPSALAIPLHKKPVTAETQKPKEKQKRPAVATPPATIQLPTTVKLK